MALRFLTLAVFLLSVEGVLACATCSGPADAPQTLGMNAAILTLFGVFCVVGVTMLVFTGLIARRIARHGSDLQPVKISATATLAIPES